ncbi:uncharacterized protein [Ptychodera flava]|uniref:uncharacterized protein n=1 Tax=Ptychodera flava TaxID=63121 RepID=UPI003969E106
MAYVTSLKTTVVFVFLAFDAAMLSNGYWTRWFHLQEDFIDEKKTLDEIHTVFPRLVCDNPSSSTEYICLDSLEKGDPCKNYKIRFCCPGKHGTDTCISDEELSKHRILYNSTIVIEENVSLGSSVFWFEEWNISASNLFLGIVDGNQFNRFCVSEDNTSIVVADLIDATITEEFFLVIHSLTKEHEILAFGLTVHVIDREDWPPYYNKTCETPIKDRNMWPLMIDFSLENRRVSDDYDDVSKQFGVVANNSACAVSIYYPVAVDRGVFKSLIDFFGTEGNLSFDGVSWVMDLIDQDKNYREVVNFKGGNSSHFESDVFKVNYTDLNQIQVAKDLSEYMRSDYIGKVTIKMIDTHVRQRCLISLQKEKTRSIGTIELLFIGTTTYLSCKASRHSRTEGSSKADVVLMTVWEERRREMRDFTLSRTVRSQSERHPTSSSSRAAHFLA